MLTVIIPTIQKRLTILEKSISMLQADPSVTEILLINNKVDTPLEFPEYSKVRVYTPKENLYVNQSWNYGVTLAKNNNYCLMNDDVLFPEGFCSKIVNSVQFNSQNTGVIGMHFSSITNIDGAEDFGIPEAPSEDWQPAFALMGDRYLGTGDWGISIFGKKEDYFKIPDRYKILFGDNWLLYKNINFGKRNYAIIGVKCHHVHSASCSSPEFTNIVCKDIITADSSEEFKGCNSPQA